MGVYSERILRAGVPNGNGRIYPRELLEKAIGKYMARTGVRFGELGMPPSFEVTLGKVSHTVDSLSIDADGYVVAEGRFLDNDRGREAESLWLEGHMRMRTRASGEVAGDGTVRNLTLFAVDLTEEPAAVEVISDEGISSGGQLGDAL